MITITTPFGFEAERCYVLEVIFGDWLNLEWQHCSEDRQDVTISVSDQLGGICLPDSFWSRVESHWLTPESLPKTPLADWKKDLIVKNANLTEPSLPIIYGESETLSHIEGNEIRLPVDIFGSIFFMLSRYEEAVLPDRDEHDRFPGVASLAFKEEFLDRPIVDEYVEALWVAMRHLWPRLDRKKHVFQVFVSCDVDHPFAFDGSLKRCVRRVGGDLFNRVSPKKALDTVLGSWEVRHGRHIRDPYRSGLDFIMDTNEKAGRKVAFYFIPEKTDQSKDQSPSLDDPRVRKLLRQIYSRGHEIGVHPGYNTYKHPRAMARSIETLRRVLYEEGIKEPLLGGRQHYLRWNNPVTPRLWNDNRLDYDTTLGYADYAGFRCGTCREFPFFDLVQRRTLVLRERPLIVMESTVASERYMDLGYGEKAHSFIFNLHETCRKFNGNFGILWHNSELFSIEQRELYQSLISP